MANIKIHSSHSIIIIHNYYLTHDCTKLMIFLKMSHRKHCMSKQFDFRSMLLSHSLYHKKEYLNHLKNSPPKHSDSDQYLTSNTYYYPRD